MQCDAMWCNVMQCDADYMRTKCNQLTCHCHTASRMHPPWVLCTGRRVQTHTPVGGGRGREGEGGSCVDIFSVLWTVVITSCSLGVAHTTERLPWEDVHKVTHHSHLIPPDFTSQSRLTPHTSLSSYHTSSSLLTIKTDTTFITLTHITSLLQSLPRPCTPHVGRGTYDTTEAIHFIPTQCYFHIRWGKSVYSCIQVTQTSEAASWMVPSTGFTWGEMG